MENKNDKDLPFGSETNKTLNKPEGFDFGSTNIEEVFASGDLDKIFSSLMGSKSTQELKKERNTNKIKGVFLKSKEIIKSMRKIKPYKYLTITALLIIGFAFYWSEFRPYLIKKTCMKEALPTDYADPRYNLRQHLTQWRNGADEIYAICLKRNGI